MHFTPSIARSVLNIVERSPNPIFQKKCRRILKRFRSRMQSITAARIETLHRLLESCGVEDIVPPPDLPEDYGSAEAICQAMGRLFAQTIRPTRFKCTISGFGAADKPDDAFSLIQSPSAHLGAALSDADPPGLLWDAADSDSPRAFASPGGCDSEDLWPDEELKLLSASQDNVCHEDTMLEHADASEAVARHGCFDDDGMLWEEDMESPVSSQDSSHDSQGGWLSDVLLSPRPHATGTVSDVLCSPALDIAFIKDWLPEESPVERNESPNIWQEDWMEYDLVSGQLPVYSPSYASEVVGTKAPPMSLTSLVPSDLAPPSRVVSEPGYAFEDLDVQEERDGAEPGTTYLGLRDLEDEFDLGSSGMHLVRRHNAFPGSPSTSVPLLCAPDDLPNVDPDVVLNFDDGWVPVLSA
ncbi:hypothetical protein GLOTRDRAFT_130102 [Gloeophyllum trabeum ATCC 11539]|uniref:Uncharacterized protein n=1 Tax=Gloeophyllum trabeum (strain ATCC 11539 / FP-39264 / Madison 617) TaxID=670483 RepID=S7RK33_GLOTA|nr:uncharacterized protein GLOTRDRAFT_130102 [Gloeophyllum trabeum ATCC 11539]EPQ54750.1 hypothetical protein GLOTRDRAFT_130102 [Gloeophyllum trabeum ATCC 11539]